MWCHFFFVSLHGIMRIVKRLDTFILGNFLPMFAGTFCISLFAVMMQFLWKYVNDLVGKGLGIDVLAKFFFYAAETLVATAFPLAVLLAALISFGNMGERLELLSIKAAGVTLWRTMRSTIVFVVLIALTSFHFQNRIAPDAYQKLQQLMFAVENKSPELEIPEGVFYSGIEGLNVYVKKKNQETGMLYTTMIYNVTKGIDNAQIVLADSARLETSADKHYLLLHMYSGAQFENQRASALDVNNSPYRRENFAEKHFLIEFDTTFSLDNAEGISTDARTKDIPHLFVGIDSINGLCDSLGRANYTGMTYRTINRPQLKDSMATAMKAKAEKVEDFDTLYVRLTTQQQAAAVQSALMKTQVQVSESDFESLVMEASEGQLRRHWIAFYQKLALSLSCIIFFFIGAPLGAIIRKGGLGMPVVVAVVVFILYYIIDTGSMKLGREGTIPVWIGMWVSSVVLAPLGVFLTVKANNDSGVFNKDAYMNFFRRIFGIAQKRNIVRKEVIIRTPDYPALQTALSELVKDIRQYRREHRRKWQIQLIPMILRNQKDEELARICDDMEYYIEELSNSKDREVLQLLNLFPVVNQEPRFYNRRRHQLKTVVRTCDKLINRIADLKGS